MGGATANAGIWLDPNGDGIPDDEENDFDKDSDAEDTPKKAKESLGKPSSVIETDDVSPPVSRRPRSTPIDERREREEASQDRRLRSQRRSQCRRRLLQ